MSPPDRGAWHCHNHRSARTLAEPPTRVKSHHAPLTVRKISHKDVEENVAVSVLYMCTLQTVLRINAKRAVSFDITTMYLDILISIGQFHDVFYVKILYT